jgi:hypothetical protein
LSGYIASLSANTTATAYSIPFAGPGDGPFPAGQTAFVATGVTGDLYNSAELASPGSVSKVGQALVDNPGKYVKLDFSGCDFTNIPAYAFCRRTTTFASPNTYSYAALTSPATIVEVALPPTLPSDPIKFTAIGNYAFYYQANLKVVNIPASVTRIDNYAFIGCTVLTSGTASINFPYGLTGIGEHVFRNCRALTSAIIPDTVTSIGGYAFQGCTGITSVSLPVNSGSPSFTTIMGCTFMGCTGITSITIPPNVTTIQAQAFYNTRLTGTVEIPSSITTIGSGSFGNCELLTDISIGGSVNATNTANTYEAINGVIYNYPSNNTIVAYPEGKGVFNFEYSPTGDLLSTVTAIGPGAFWGYNRGTNTLDIPFNLTTIGNDAFNASNFRTVKIINPALTIGNNSSFPNGDYYSNTFKQVYDAQTTKEGTYKRSGGGGTAGDPTSWAWSP